MEIPQFRITDKPERTTYVIRWRGDSGEQKSLNSSYIHQTKEEDMRYDLIMQWLGKHKGYSF